MANVKQFKQKTTGTLLDIEDTQARSDIASEVTCMLKVKLLPIFMTSVLFF